MFESIIHSIEILVNIISLGSWNDLNSLLTVDVQTNSAVTLFAIILTAIKWGLLISAIFLFWWYVLKKAGFTAIVAIILTVVCVGLIFLIYNTPMNDATTIQHRMSALTYALFSNQTTNYTPSLLTILPPSIHEPLNFTRTKLKTIETVLPNNTTVPSIQVGGGKPITITSTTISISWLGWLIYFAILVVIVYLISKFSKVVAGIIAIVVLLVLFSIPDEVVASVLLLVLGIGLVYLALKTELKILIAYSVAIFLLITAFLIQPPQQVLVAMIFSAFVISIMPFFYTLGWVIYTVGEFAEGREKFGLKIRPKKYLEEYYGEWDVNAVTIILTLLFVAVVILFGLTTTGIGTFAAISFGMLRR